MSPRSQEQIEKIRKQSISKILEAAFQLMATNGYEATSISQIAIKAGVSKGLMYNYFDSKEELLRALVEDAFAAADKLKHEIVDEDPRTTLENIFRWYFKELKERPERWRLITELTMKIGKFEFVRDMARRKLLEYVGFIGSLLEQLGCKNPREEAQSIAGLFDGIGIQYLVIGQDYPLEMMEKFLIEKYCK